VPKKAQIISAACAPACMAPKSGTTTPTRASPASTPVTSEASPSTSSGTRASGGRVLIASRRCDADVQE